MAKISRDGFLISEDILIDLRKCYRVRLIGNDVHVNERPINGQGYAVDIYRIDGDAQNQWNEAFKPHDHTK